MTRFGRMNEIHARAQKSVNLDRKLEKIVGKKLKGGEKFDDAINRYLDLGLVCEEAHSPKLKLNGNDRFTTRLNLEEYIIVALRQRQQHHESYSDTVNRYLWLGLACEAKLQE